ncbi:MAG: 30S ribosomal protein S18 [bacterium]
MADETKQQNTAAPVHQNPAQTGARPSFQRKRTFGPRRKVCRLCAEKIEKVDYKQFPIIRTFITDTGKILSSRITGACARHQRQIARAIKRSRNMALLPYTINN